MSTNAYESPFSSRYASEEMQYVFSQDNKFKTWRKLWIALAKAEKALGINITDEQIAELEGCKYQAIQSSIYAAIKTLKKFLK